MIETQLAENTAALVENNSLLRQLISMSTQIPTPQSAEKGTPAKVKKEKLTVVTAEPEPVAEETPEPEPVAEETPEPEPVVEETPEPEPVVEETPEPEAPQFPTNRNAALNLITEVVKNAYATAGDTLQAKQDAFGEIRKSFGVERAGELKDEQLEAFYREVVKL